MNVVLLKEVTKTLYFPSSSSKMHWRKSLTFQSKIVRNSGLAEGRALLKMFWLGPLLSQLTKYLPSWNCSQKQGNLSNQVYSMWVSSCDNAISILSKVCSLLEHSSLLSKLWSFLIPHQVTSEQSQLMICWKWPQFWKKWTEFRNFRLL